MRHPRYGTDAAPPLGLDLEVYPWEYFKVGSRIAKTLLESNVLPLH